MKRRSFVAGAAAAVAGLCGIRKAEAKHRPVSFEELPGSPVVDEPRYRYLGKTVGAIAPLESATVHVLRHEFRTDSQGSHFDVRQVGFIEAHNPANATIGAGKLVEIVYCRVRPDKPRRWNIMTAECD